MMITMAPFIVGALPKNLEKKLKEVEIRGRIETIQTTELLRPTRILRRVLEGDEEIFFT